MKFVCHKSRLQGDVPIPGSKSHTIRAVAIAAMASGESLVDAPLVSADTLSALSAIKALGAAAEMHPDQWCIRGTAGQFVPRQREIDVGNSGTTLRVAMGLASLLREGTVTLTGDEQIQRRPAGPLAQALNDLGAKTVSLKGNDCAPFSVTGTLRGGRTAIEARTSQYVTSLLLACPLAENDTQLELITLNERPYVQMTLDWLRSRQIQVEHDDMRSFSIPGQQAYSAFRRRIPADFSSATFFLGAGALGENQVTSRGLDMSDSQADKAVVAYLREMGAQVDLDGDSITVTAHRLQGVELDLNATPDALPVMAVVGCFAAGETRLRNVAHARIKETDRIAVMCRELRRMGATVEELPDGLVVRESRLRGAPLDGHGDHRVVMALALAGMCCDGETTVTTAEAAGVTFPNFAELITSLGGQISQIDDA